MATVGMLLYWALQLYMLLFFVRMILSFVPAISPGFTPRGAVLVIFETVYTLTDPLINLFERFLPPVRMGNVAFSLGFIAAWFTLVLAQRMVISFFF